VTKDQRRRPYALGFNTVVDGSAMKIVVLGAVAIGLLPTAAQAASKLHFGSRAGMEVTVVSSEGLDTERAVIRTKYTREDATRFCVEYVGKVTAQCINEQLGLRLNDRVSANCKTGEFVDFYGQRHRFEGRRRGQPGELGFANFVLRNLATDEIADGSNASGYPTNMRIFRALCPSKAPAPADE
jgi:hypothetical protein